MTDWTLKLQNEQGCLVLSYQGGDGVVEIFTTTPQNPQMKLLLSVPLDEYAHFMTKAYALAPDEDD